MRAESGANADMYVEAGRVSAVIRQAAVACKANLIVIGRGHIHKLLGRLRTNAYEIIREAPCPVLSI